MSKNLMGDMDAETINRLIIEGINGVGTDGIYKAALPYVKAQEQKNETEDAFNYNRAFAVGGFAAGIEFVLRNIEIYDDKEGAEK